MEHGVGELLGVAVFGEESGDVGDADFGCAVDVEGDDGFGCEECLREDAGESFPVAGMDDDIHGVEIIGDIFGLYETGEVEVAGESELVDALLVVFAEDAIADEEEAGVGECLDDGWCGFDEVVMTFEVKESGDFAEDDVMWLESEFGADFGGWSLGSEKTVDVHTAVDGGVTFGCANAGCEVLGGHGVADGDEMLAPACSGAFGHSVGVPCEWILAEVEGGPVDGMDSGNVQLVCGESSEDSGFGAVGMDDFGLELAEGAADGTECEQVLPGANAAAEFREYAEVEAALSGALFERAFGTGAGAGNQADLITVDVVLVVDIEKRVFLGSAEDQSGDDVGGAHGICGGPDLVKALKTAGECGQGVIMNYRSWEQFYSRSFHVERPRFWVWGSDWFWSAWFAVGVAWGMALSHVVMPAAVAARQAATQVLVPRGCQAPTPKTPARNPEAADVATTSRLATGGWTRTARLASRRRKNRRRTMTRPARRKLAP